MPTMPKLQKQSMHHQNQKNCGDDDGGAVVAVVVLDEHTQQLVPDDDGLYDAPICDFYVVQVLVRDYLPYVRCVHYVVLAHCVMLV